jgi:hypothetical protein
MVVSPTFWRDHIYSESIKWVQILQNKNKNFNHDFEYRMIAKKWFSCLAEDIVTIVLKMTA